MIVHQFHHIRLLSGFAYGWCLCPMLIVMFLLTPLRAGELDDSLRPLLSQAGVGPLPRLQHTDAAKIDLGQRLFFDKELSGNRDIACASCHHPQLMTGDARSLPVGTAGEGLGPDRRIGEGRDLVPRNSPEIFHRGQEEWTSMFWDSRVSKYDGQFKSPAGDKLPADLDDVLAVQAMFPVTSRTEMRGGSEDSDVHGAVNELAAIEDGDLSAIWQTLTNRLTAIPEYERRFAEAFPNVPPEELGFQHAANAIGAFEANAFAQTDSAWDRYLGGDDSALTDGAKRGAHVFFGQGNCASCHAGSLMTDQEHHNIGVPQLGPGKEASSPLDIGRALETDEEEDQFAFRTPPLRNVAATGPWMHNGAYTELDDAVRHYSDPSDALHGYDVSQLDEALQSTVPMDDDTIGQILATLDDRVLSGPALTGEQVDDLTAFLFSLTSPSIDKLLGIVPDSVPSGLPVDGLPPSPVSLRYNEATGELIVDAPGGISLSSLFLRLSSGPDGADFDFLVDQAAWSGDEAIVLSADSRAQSFLEYRRDQSFLLHAGDSVGTLLPGQLSQEDLDEYLTAVYMEGNTSVLWEADIVLMLGLIVGDFNEDGILSDLDIDLLTAAVRDGINDEAFDLNGDGNVNEADRMIWVGELAGTFFGDTDLNQIVEFADFLALSGHFAQQGGWAQGDFDGNGEIAFPDLLALSTNYGQSNATAGAVPEPTSLVMVGWAMLTLAARCRIAGKR